jgi:ribosomal protein L37AE/L43A
MNSSEIKNRKQAICSNCQSSEFETNDQGFVCCVGCGIMQEQTKFDNNVVFG